MASLLKSKLTCNYGFEWDAEIIAENVNTVVIEDVKTHTRHLVRKEELDPNFKPKRMVEKTYVGRKGKRKYKESYGLFKTKEDLIVYQNKVRDRRTRRK